MIIDINIPCYYYSATSFIFGFIGGLISVVIFEYIINYLTSEDLKENKPQKANSRLKPKNKGNTRQC